MAEMFIARKLCLIDFLNSFIAETQIERHAKNILVSARGQDGRMFLQRVIFDQLVGQNRILLHNFVRSDF